MSDTAKTGSSERQDAIKECIVRVMARCGPADSWKKNEKPDLANVIIELCNLLTGPFGTDDAIEVGERIGVTLWPPEAVK